MTRQKNRPNQTSLMIPNSQVIDLWKVPENTKDQILVCFHVVPFTVDIFQHHPTSQPNDVGASAVLTLHMNVCLIVFLFFWFSGLTFAGRCLLCEMWCPLCGLSCLHLVLSVFALQVLHQTFPQHTFLMNGLIHGVKVSTSHKRLVSVVCLSWQRCYSDRPAGGHCNETWANETLITVTAEGACFLFEVLQLLRDSEFVFLLEYLLRRCALVPRRPAWH